MHQVHEVPTRRFLAVIEAPALLELAACRADVPMPQRARSQACRRGMGKRPWEGRWRAGQQGARRFGEGTSPWDVGADEVHNMPRNRTDAGEAGYVGASGSSAACPTEVESRR